MGSIIPKLLLTIFTAALLLTLGACDYFASDESRVQKAAQLRTQGDYRAAVIQLKKVLQRNPGNRDARLLLGNMSLLIGQAAAAEKELRHARELGIPKDNVIISLGQALVDQGEFDRALEELNPDGIDDDETKIGVLALRGEIYLARGKLNDAERAFRDVLVLRPDSLDARLGLAGVENGKGNLKAAEAYIADALSKDSTYTPASMAKGRFELGRGQYAEAEQAFARVLERPQAMKKEFTARSGLAESQWRLGKADAALQNVERLLKLAPQDPRPKYFRALIAYGAGDYKTAKEYLQQALRGFPDYRAAEILLGATHYAQGDFEQADMYLTSVLAADPSSVSARKLLAATRLRQQKPNDAVAALAPAISQGSSDGQLLALMGSASLRAGDTDNGIRYLQRSAGTDPANPVLQMELAAGYLSTGGLEQAIGLLEKMPETKEGRYGRELLLILSYLRKGDSASALALADHLVASRPNDPGVHNLAGNVCIAAGQMPRAREHYEKALELQPDNVAVLMSLARLDLLEGKQDNARARLERVLALHADNLNAMLGLADLCALRDDQPGVGQWLERASAAHPRAVEPKLLLARHYLETGDLDRARRVATDLAKAEPANPDVQNVLGNVQMADRKYEEAAASFRRSLEAAPNAPNFAYGLARAELSLQHVYEAKKVLAKTLERQPGYLPAISTLAAIEMGEGNAKQALARARALQQQDDTSMAGHLLEGDLYMMQRQFDGAARAYDATSKQAQSAPLAIKSYLARKQARMPDAVKPLEEWLSTHPDDARVRLMLAQGYQERGRLKQSAAEYERVLKSNPDNAATLNNLAWVYHETNDPRALGTAERAYKMQPESGAIADTFGWLLVQEGQTERGLKLLREAAKQAPHIPDIRYHLAVALAKTGAKEEARNTLAGLLNSGQSFKDVAEAKQLLQQL